MMSNQAIVDVLQRVQNNAIYIGGNWYKLSRKTKLPGIPLTNLIGTTVKVKISGKWVDEIQPVKRSKDIAYLQEYIDEKFADLQETLLKELEVKFTKLENQLNEVLDLLSKYLLEEIKYEKHTKQ